MLNKYKIPLLAGSIIILWILILGLSTGNLSVAPSPCNEPLTFTIGTIDSQFGISDEEVKSAMNVAVSVWSTEAGRELGRYDEDGKITINFVYDERQQLTDGELQFRERIRSEQHLLDQIQREINVERDRFDDNSSTYMSLAEETGTELRNLNQWIEEVNNNGGFNDESLKEYQTRKEQVETKQQQVLNKREDLDRLATNINRSVERAVEKSEEINSLISQYNRDYSGENRFTKATFQRVGNGGIITVNQFTARQELPLLLAHEFGHALGLNHISNPESIMYRRIGMQQTYPQLQLSNQDKQALQERCQL